VQPENGAQVVVSIPSAAATKLWASHAPHVLSEDAEPATDTKYPASHPESEMHDVSFVPSEMFGINFPSSQDSHSLFVVLVPFTDTKCPFAHPVKGMHKAWFSCAANVPETHALQA
jgi:hypothetical protein